MKKAPKRKTVGCLELRVCQSLFFCCAFTFLGATLGSTGTTFGCALDATLGSTGTALGDFLNTAFGGAAGNGHWGNNSSCGYDSSSQGALD
ncbi:MAG: hypothetical protein WA888_19140 [Burkholderiaceae bacterium]